MDPDCELMDIFEKEKGHTEKVWVFRKPLIISFCFLTISYVIILALFITVFYKVSTLSLKVNHLEIPRNNTAGINILDLKTLNEMRSNASEFASKLRKLETSTKNTTGVSQMDLVNKLNEVRSNDTTGVFLMDLVNKLNEVRSNVSEIASKLRELENSTKKVGCDFGWFTFRDSCYYFTIRKNTWTTSRSTCLEWKVIWLQLPSAEEQRFLYSKSSEFDYWIGLSEIDTEGVWKWLDGTDYETSYKYWQTGEPNDHSNKEDCAHATKTGQWNDIACSNKYYAICEKKTLKNSV
ncbi:CD209 antigen-like protein C isoform X2 [Bombina bombina]|uniref:CD209 antigen-like protein C isoform X2 n=1 Tax=Bombina bombina TaxID=8345 RepID=UPI00235A7073|nr:CD209 antigen-like protein C isoform X2 [Bombina bombina]